MRHTQTCVILNAGSGKRKAGEMVPRINRAFAEAGRRFDLRLVRNGSDITREAQRAIADGAQTIIAAGGDGTIAAVASVVAGTDVAFGALPLGTFNYFTRSIGLPQELEPAIHALVDGTAAPARLGLVNDRVFINNASLGAYPAILKRRESIYARWGRSRVAAYWSVFTTLVQLRTRLTVRATVDGEVHHLRSPLIFVSFNPYQLDQLGLEGAEAIRDGKFAIFVAPDGTRREMLGAALRLAGRLSDEARDFRLITGRDVQLDTARPRQLVACDGELERMRTPLRFEIREGGINLIRPRNPDPEV